MKTRGADYHQEKCVSTSRQCTVDILDVQPKPFTTMLLQQT